MCDYEERTGLTHTRPLTKRCVCHCLLGCSHHLLIRHNNPSPHMPFDPLEPSGQAAPRTREGGDGGCASFGSVS
jgi:hypothetical protein